MRTLLIAILLMLCIGVVLGDDTPITESSVTLNIVWDGNSSDIVVIDPNDVNEPNDIAVWCDDCCPNCKVPTDRMILGSRSTLMYFPVILKADGTYEETGHNTVYTDYRCLKCGEDFTVSN